MRREYPGVPIMALTATANRRVSDDIVSCLGIQGCKRLTQSFNRPNLHYEVRKKPSTNDKWLVGAINAFIQGSHSGETGIIYCHSKNKCEEVAAQLREAGVSAKHYHAGMTPDDRMQIQQEWKDDEFKVVVATVRHDFTENFACSDSWFHKDRIWGT